MDQLNTWRRLAEALANATLWGSKEERLAVCAKIQEACDLEDNFPTEEEQCSASDLEA